MYHKHTLKTLLLGLGLLLSSQTLSAEESFSDELESFFAISLIGGITETNLLDQDFNRIDETDSFLSANIEIQLRWKGFFYENPGNSQENVNGLFSGDALGYNFYNDNNWAVDIYAVHAFGKEEFFFNALVESVDEQTGEVTREVNRLVLYRDSDYRLGLRATGYFSDYLTQFIATPVSFNDEIGGVNLSASIRRTWLYKNWNFYGTIGLNYQSSEIVNYHWGLSPEESEQIAAVMQTNDSPFQPYEAGSGIYGVAEVGFEYPISESFVFGGFYSTVIRSDALNDTPLSVAGRFVNTAGLSVTYVF